MKQYKSAFSDEEEEPEPVTGSTEAETMTQGTTDGVPVPGEPSQDSGQSQELELRRVLMCIWNGLDVNTILLHIAFIVSVYVKQYLK